MSADFALDGDVFNNRDPVSDHVGGVNLAMGDGRVIWVDKNISPAIYRALFTISGNESVTLPD